MNEQPLPTAPTTATATAPAAVSGARRRTATQRVTWMLIAAIAVFGILAALLAAVDATPFALVIDDEPVFDSDTFEGMLVLMLLGAFGVGVALLVVGLVVPIVLVTVGVGLVLALVFGLGAPLLAGLLVVGLVAAPIALLLWPLYKLIQ
jgi:hypothetical protein